MCASALFSCTLCACGVHLMWTAHCKCRRTEARLKPKLKHKPSLVLLLKLLLAVEPPGRKRARRPNGSKLDQAFFFLSFLGVQLKSFFLSSFFFLPGASAIWLCKSASPAKYISRYEYCWHILTIFLNKRNIVQHFKVQVVRNEHHQKIPFTKSLYWRSLHTSAGNLFKFRCRASAEYRVHSWTH